MFEGFTEDTCDFLWGVRLNNYRDWFQPRKQTYIDSVYEPMKALGRELELLFQAEYPLEGFEVKVSRIYRDMRGVKYGGPYKDHLWLVLRRPREDTSTRPGFYFGIQPEGYEYGMGYYEMKPALMERYRRRIQRDPKPLEKLVRRFNKDGIFHLEGAEYRRSKGETSKLLQPWFNRKVIDLCRFCEADDRMMEPRLVEELMADFRTLMPLYRWFQELELEPPVTD